MDDPEILIREINGAELDRGAEVIRESFKTVAVELGFSRDNIPNHPSFMTTEQLKELIDKGVKFFGLFLDGKQVGSVAVEEAEDGMYFLQKLAIIPQYRNKGYGREMVEFVLDYVRHNGCTKLALGIWEKQTELKDWYLRLGFRVAEIRDFEHLPITVCLMDMKIA